MIYLNVILTLIFLVLLSFFILGVFMIKKYGKSISQMKKMSDTISPNNIPIDNKQIEESMKMLSSIFGKK